MSDEQEIRQQRLAKLESLRARGQDPYAHEKYDRTHLAAEIRANFEALEGKDVAIAGRLVQGGVRVMGKAAFADLRDGSDRIQIYAKRDDLGEDAYEQFKDLDIGDIVGVKGFVFRTRAGEISIHVRE